MIARRCQWENWIMDLSHVSCGPQLRCSGENFVIIKWLKETLSNSRFIVQTNNNRKRSSQCLHFKRGLRRKLKRFRIRDQKTDFFPTLFGSRCIKTFYDPKLKRQMQFFWASREAHLERWRIFVNETNARQWIGDISPFIDKVIPFINYFVILHFISWFEKRNLWPCG